MVIGQSETEGLAVRSSASWRFGLEVRLALLVAVRAVRSDTATLAVALLAGSESSHRRLFPGLDVRLAM